jgi:hypothetical protein
MQCRRSVVLTLLAMTPLLTCKAAIAYDGEAAEKLDFFVRNSHNHAVIFEPGLGLLATAGDYALTFSLLDNWLTISRQSTNSNDLTAGNLLMSVESSLDTGPPLLLDMALADRNGNEY